MSALLFILFLFPLFPQKVLANDFSSNLAGDLPASSSENFAKHSQQILTDAFDRQGLWILAAGTTLTILAHQCENSVRDGAKNHQSMDPSVTKIGEFWGSGIPEVTILGVQYFYDEKNAIPGIEGLAASTLFAQVLKYSAHRERPNGQENVSMPSGHTQASFSLAASMTTAYGWKKSWPFWALGVFTGMTRISDDQHWLSDVTAGATIGIIFGRAGFRHHQDLLPVVLFHQGQPDGAFVNYQFNW